MARASLFRPPCSASMIRGARLTDGAACIGGVAVVERRAALNVQVAVGPDGDAEEVAQAMLQLRRELLDRDVDAVKVPGAGEPPPGSRAVNVAALGAPVVNIADSQLLTAAVAAVRSWLAESSWRSIKLQLGSDALELTGVSPKEQRRSADAWPARLTAP